MPYELINQSDLRQTIQTWIDQTLAGDALTIQARTDASGRSYFIHQTLATNPSPKTINLIDLLKSFSDQVQIESIQHIGKDQSSAIEVRMHKHQQAATQMVPAIPTKSDLINRALRLYAAKEYESVLDILDRYSWIATQSGDILNAAGASAFALRCPEYAISLYRRATQVMPNHYDAWNNLGIALFDSGKHSEAEQAHRRAIALRPKEKGFQGDLVKVLISTHQFTKAKAICEAQLARDPNSLFFLGELGAIHTRLGNPTRAREYYDRILTIEPDSESVAINCGVRLFQAGYWDDAEKIYRRTLEKHQSELARFHLSILLLTQGRFAEGWKHYESRAAVRKHPLPEYPFSRWQGELLIGKSILISYEQGYGDEIMMARYGTILKRAGAKRVGLVCRRPLATLMQTVEGVEVLTPVSGDAVLTLKDDEYDYWVLPFEIARYLGTALDNIPAPVPYIYTTPERRSKWQEIIVQKMQEQTQANAKINTANTTLKVGLVWKGSALHGADKERSLVSLEQLKPLWEVSGVQYISLQKGQGEEEAEMPPATQPMIHVGGMMDDFADLAAIVEQLDLVIAVDTAVVHVAGALNKPCWTLIPYYATDWRWMLDREDTPWYPSVKLYRQDASGNWKTTINQIAKALTQMQGPMGGKRKNNPRLVGA